MNQQAFAFLSVTKQPKAAPDKVMRLIETEADAVAFSVLHSGLKQKQVADGMFVDESTVSLWIHGKRRIPDTRLLRFCTVTNSLALSQFRDAQAREAMLTATETRQQMLARLIAMEAAA